MKVCSVCGKDWMRGANHAIWCGGFGRSHGKSVSAERLIVCPVCSGATKIVARGVSEPCPMCKGDGQVVVDESQTEPVPWMRGESR